MFLSFSHLGLRVEYNVVLTMSPKHFYAYKTIQNHEILILVRKPHCLLLVGFIGASASKAIRGFIDSPL